MTVRNGGFPGDCYRNNFYTPGGYEEGSACPNPSELPNSFRQKEDDTFGVPRLVVPLSGLSSSERNDLIHRLRQELEQIRSYQKDVVLPRSKPVISTPASTLSKPKTFGTRCSTAPGKKVLPISAPKPAPLTTSLMLRMKQCQTLLKLLMSQESAWPFNTPVDVVKLNIPDYFTIIKHPMDLGTVKSKLTSGTYSSPSEFSADVRLTFSNAMTYNPPGNVVYAMADTLSKFFEVRWKVIEKKSTGTKSKPSNLGTNSHNEIAMPTPLTKKRKMNALEHDSLLEPVKRVMADDDRVKLGRDLASLTEFPAHILSFLRKHCSKEGGSGDDEIEIDINDLSHDALFQLRDLLDEFSRGNQKKSSSGEPCELELRHGSGPENSLMQHGDGSEVEDEDVDVGSYEHTRSGISSVRTGKGVALGNSNGCSSLESVPDNMFASAKEPESMDLDSPLDKVTSSSPKSKSSISELEHLEDASKEKPSSIDGAECHQDGNSAQNEKQLPPEKRQRAALLKNRFADLILKAQEKTLYQNEKRNPEKLRREREELELRKKKEKARLQAEAKEAEEARRKAEAEAAAEAAAEAKRKLELDREAARQALVEMEKSVEIDENARFLKDLELLKTVDTEHLRDISEEEDGLGGLGFGGSNALEQLGLFMKHEEEEEADLEIEEGEID